MTSGDADLKHMVQQDLIIMVTVTVLKEVTIMTSGDADLKYMVQQDLIIMVTVTDVIRKDLDEVDDRDGPSGARYLHLCTS